MCEVEWFDGVTQMDWLKEEPLKVNGDRQRENGSSGTNEVEYRSELQVIKSRADIQFYSLITRTHRNNRCTRCNDCSCILPF